jgi:hypothetical protein
MLFAFFLAVLSFCGKPDHTTLPAEKEGLSATRYSRCAKLGSVPFANRLLPPLS